MTWLNWSLKFHLSLRNFSHLILTHNTQDFDSMNAYLICVIVHVQMWCVCSNTCWSNPKRFLSVLFIFESDFILSCLIFLFKMHLCLSSKTSLEVVSREARDLELPAKKAYGNKLFHFVIQKLSLLYCDYLATNSFSRNVVWLKLDFSKIKQKLLLLSRDCFATYSFLRKLMCISGLSRDCLATVSLLSNPQKLRVFSF